MTANNLNNNSGKIIGILILLIATAFGVWMVKYFAWGQQGVVSNNDADQRYKIEIVVENLEVPWSIAWTSPNRMLVSERDGRLRQIVDGVLVNDPLIDFENVSSIGESGLMGIAVDPNYQENKFIYACYAYMGNDGLMAEVIRLKDQSDKAVFDKIIIQNIPSANNHAGCAIEFGPDEKLYITTGDATDKETAQDRNSLAGKILRVNSDGTVPDDNPYVGSPIYSLGHRNPQGIDWHPVTGEMYETEHGPSVFDGPAGGDEINRIVSGGNYGWPEVSHDKIGIGMISPLKIFTPAEAPGSAEFYSQDKFPNFKNNLFFGALRGEGIVRVVIDDENKDKIVKVEKLSNINVGRIRAISEGPDGYLYFSTSNRDGRGKPFVNDDKIYRIVPLE